MPDLPNLPRPKAKAAIAFLTACLPLSSLQAAHSNNSEDFYDLSLQQLLSTEIEVGSFFKEKIEDVGSTVSLVTRDHDIFEVGVNVLVNARNM